MTGSKEMKEFDVRLAKHEDELRWLYMELYQIGRAHV